MLADNLEIATINCPIEYVNIDDQPELAKKFGVRGVPTLVMVDGETEIKRLVGLKTATELERWAE